MTITDQSRYHLHQKLDAALGADEAATLMEHLPPVGWADVATRRDLDHVEAIMRSDLAHATAELRGEIQVATETMRAETQGMINRLTMQLMASQLALVAIVLGITRLG